MQSRRAEIAAMTVAGACAVGLAIAAWIRSGLPETVDVALARTLNRAVSPHPTAVTFWRTVSLVGGPVVWDVLAAGVAVALCVRRRFRAAAVVVIALAGAATLSTVLKLVIGRPRPSVPTTVAHATGMSFPSGHALTSSVAVGVLLLVLLPAVRRGARGWLTGGGILVVAAIGFSRLILGVHYLTDVLGAWSIAVVWLLTVVRVGRPGSPPVGTPPRTAERDLVIG